MEQEILYAKEKDSKPRVSKSVKIRDEEEIKIVLNKSRIETFTLTYIK